MAKKATGGLDKLIPRMTHEGIESLITTIESNTTMLVNSSGFSRSGASPGNMIPGFKKDIAKEAGYAIAPTVKEFKKWFEREGFCRRVVELWPEEIWQLQPEVYEDEDIEKTTAFEEAWELLVKRFQLWSELKRLQVVTGLGRFGLMVMGFSDGKELSEEIPMQYDPDLNRYKPIGASTRKLIWMTPYSEDLVQISAYEEDPSHPRFGWPTEYMVTMAAPTTATNGSTGTLGDASNGKKVKVHWTRTYHHTIGRLSSKVFGTPEMEASFNRLYDIMKIAAGSGEGYWQSANPTLVVSSDNPLPGGFDKEAMRQQIWRLQNSLQKYLTIAGMSAEMLSPDLKEPTAHLDAQLTLLCVGIGVPKRVFLGTEEAKLAGDQDKSVWSARVQHKRVTETGPALILPFTYHLMACGVVPFVEELFTEWPDAAKPDEASRAATAKLWTEALVSYSDSANASIVMPEAEYLHRVWQMDPDEVEELLAAMEDAIAEADAAEPDLQQMVDPATGLPIAAPAPTTPKPPAPPKPVPPK